MMSSIVPLTVPYFSLSNLAISCPALIPIILQRFKVYSDASPYGVVRIYSGLERQTVQARKMVSDAICEVLIGKKTAPQAMADLKAQLLALKDR